MADDVRIGLELGDIQGIILAGYGHLPQSAYLFLEFGDPAGARAWLGWIADLVTTADWEDDSGKRVKPEVGVNLALSAPGLLALGLSRSNLTTFAHEFVEGMAYPPRPRRMGDVGGSDPALWEFGGGKSPTPAEIHALLILQAADAPALDALCADHQARLRSHGIRESVPKHVAFQEKDSREHFGFHDSISQPQIKGSPNSSDRHQSVVEPGEFILGYTNEYGVLPQGPVVEAADDPANLLPIYVQDAGGPPPKDIGRNGSYLVVRKLEQDVAAWRRFLRDNTSSPEEMTYLGAKLMGRWPGGAPLAISPTDDPARSLANDFGYAKEDPYGYRCPMGAHMRRANPRDLLVGDTEQSQKVVNRHRLIRRGVLYGDYLPDGAFEDDGQPRGILFICINADIERQFEFVQQTWVNSPKFGGAYTDSDPVIGPNLDPLVPESDDPGPWTMTIPDESGRRQLPKVPRFVTVKGGGYFFLPSIVAMRYIASRGGTPDAPPAATR